MKKIVQLFFILLTISSYAQDGTIDTSFNTLPGAINGGVNIIVKQADGKILVGGNFSKLNNTPANKFGRLNSDGTTDDSFTIGSGFNNVVHAISIQSDGKILVAGDFTSYNGISINRLIRLNVDGTFDPTFDVGTGANNSIYSTSVQSDGKIIVVGNFTSFNNIFKNRIIRLNVDGSLDLTFNITSGANDDIFSSVIQNDGKILIAGMFTSYNGVARQRIARINTDGTLDLTFNSMNGPNDTVRTICFLSNGQIVIGGNFTSYNNTSSNYIARLNSNGTLDTTFNIGIGFSYYVKTITAQSDDKLLVGGIFWSFNNVSCSRIARLNVDGSIDTTFITYGTNESVNTIINQANGKILLGGNFTNYDGYLRNGLASSNVQGSIDTTFYPYYSNGNTSNGQIRAVALQSDQKIIIGGLFDTYNGISSRNIARLNSDGTIDQTFNIGTGANSMIQKIAVLPNNKIIIVGDFTTYNGVTCKRIARLNSDGTLDTTFNSGGSGASDSIHTVSIQTDGKIIIGGDFFSYNGNVPKWIVRLNSNGTYDSTFNTGGTGGDGSIWSTAIQSDGKIIIGGLLTSYNGVQTGTMTRLNSNGTKDATFNVGGTGSNSFVYSISIQNDGKIIIGGNFATYNNYTLSTYGLARLNPNGSLDTTFNSTIPGIGFFSTAIQSDGKIITSNYRLNTNGSIDTTYLSGTGFDSTVFALTIQNDNKILAGGMFSTYNGVNKSNILRLNNSNFLNLNEINSENEINIYPNPVQDYMTFILPNNLRASEFEVYDTLGKKIDSNTLKYNYINVNNYSDGIYFLHLKTESGILITKFIKN